MDCVDWFIAGVVLALIVAGTIYYDERDKRTRERATGRW